MILLISACATPRRSERTSASAPAGARTYYGILPCPLDCKNVVTELTLLSNHQFSMEENYRSNQEADKIEQSWGEWSMVEGNSSHAKAQIYELISDQFEQERYFLRVSDDVLRALDEQGEEVLTKQNVTLKRIKNK